MRDWSLEVIERNRQDSKILRVQMIGGIETKLLNQMGGGGVKC